LSSPAKMPESVSEKRADQVASESMFGQELEEEPRRHSNASLSPTEHDGDVVPSEGKEGNEMELARTKSIAETLSLPREIIFVAIVCSAQLLTRKAVLHSAATLLTPSQKLDWETYRPLFMSLATTLVFRMRNCHG
jgi:hypothetical protein